MMTRLLCAILLIAAASGLGGCVALGVGAAAAAGGVEYAEGRATATLDASMERVYHAAVAEMDSKKYPVTHKQLGAEAADIDAENKSGDKIRIDIEPKGDKMAELKVRVGLTGNKNEESAILDSIKHRVG
jgi:uncharacterized protein (DUF1786 family)